MKLTTKALLCGVALCAMMLQSVEAQAASVSWSAGTGAYDDPANWGTGTVPTSGDKMTVGNGGTATISTGESVSLQDFRINKDSELVVEAGGVLGSTGWSFLGKSGTPGTTGTMTMNGGLVQINRASLNDGGISSFIVGRESHGILNMNGGLLFVQGNFKIDDKAKDGGEVYLNGGSIFASGFDMDKGGAGGNSAVMDITNGTMLIVGDIESYIDTQVGTGILTAFGGSGIVLRSYDPGSGITTVSATIPEPASLALLGIAGMSSLLWVVAIANDSGNFS